MVFSYSGSSLEATAWDNYVLHMYILECLQTQGSVTTSNYLHYANFDRYFWGRT